VSIHLIAVTFEIEAQTSSRAFLTDLTAGAVNWRPFDACGI
jgi:hypothetical protein